MRNQRDMMTIMTITEQIPINHPIMRMVMDTTTIVMDTTTTMVMDTTTTMVMDTTTTMVMDTTTTMVMDTTTTMVMDTTTTMVMDTRIRIKLPKYFQLTKYQNLEIDGGNGFLA